MRVSLNSVNKAIKAAGIPGELVKGDGYFYMTDSRGTPNADLVWAMAYNCSVMVYHITTLTIEQWVSEIKQLYENRDKIGKE